MVGKDGLSTEAQRNATVTFMALLRASLASKRVLKVRPRAAAAGGRRPQAAGLQWPHLATATRAIRATLTHAHNTPTHTYTHTHLHTHTHMRTRSPPACTHPTLCAPQEYRLNKEAFQWMTGEVERRFNIALANYGEAIGTIAAQSIGEPTTQVGAARPGRARAACCLHFLEGLS